MNLVLRRVTITDLTIEMIPTFMKYHNDLEWMIFQGLKGLTLVEYQEKLLVKTDWFEGKQIGIIDNENKKLIGDIYVKFDSLSTCTIGYTIRPEYAKMGYMKETLQGLISWLKMQEITEVCATVLMENEASIQLLRSLSFNIFQENTKECILNRFL